MKIHIFLRKYGRILAFIFITIVGSITMQLVIKRIFTITKIEVVGSGLQVIIDEKRIPTNLILFPAEKIRNELLNDNPLLADVQFEKKLPGTLIIRPVIRTAIAKLQTNNEVFLLDETGIVLGPAGMEKSLPLVMIDIGPRKTGEKVTDGRVLTALHFLRAVKGLGMVDTITMLDTESLRIKFEKIDIFITQNSDIPMVTSTLQTLVARFRIKGTLPTIIDLRFNKPIVTF